MYLTPPPLTQTISVYDNLKEAKIEHEISFK